jgi:hypothetical protein
MSSRPVARRVLGSAAVVAIVALAGVAEATGGTSAVPLKVTLGVTVVGQGKVTSRPAGISCPTACKMRVSRGSSVVLTATPAAGSVFSRWVNGCAAARTCRTTVSASRVVGAVFKTKPSVAPAPTPPPPPPPAPAPTAKPGHYAGTYTDGSRFAFDVDSAGALISNISFDFNGECPGYGTSYGALTEPGPYGLAADGSFTVNDSFSDSNQTKYVLAITGTVTPAGTGSGTAQVGLAFSDGVTCSTHGTWTATTP